MPQRHELTDGRRQPIADPFPARQRGGPRADHRAISNGIMRRPRAGAPRRDLPGRYGPWQAVHRRFDDMRKTGPIDRPLDRRRARLDAGGLIDAERWCIDGTVIRAAGAAAAPQDK